jgi:hypothetical protein
MELVDYVYVVKSVNKGVTFLKQNSCKALILLELQFEVQVPLALKVHNA